MFLNAFRDEAGAFLKAVDPAGDEPLSKIVGMLDEEIAALKTSLDALGRLSHQVTGVLFLSFELAAKKDVDIDREWARGRERKRAYTGE